MAELREHLTTSTTRPRRVKQIGDDCTATQRADPSRNRTAHRGTFGANGEAKAGILDVAANKDAAVIRKHRSTNAEVRSWHVCVDLHLPGGNAEFFNHTRC